VDQVRIRQEAKLPEQSPQERRQSILCGHGRVRAALRYARLDLRAVDEDAFVKMPAGAAEFEILVENGETRVNADLRQLAPELSAGKQSIHELDGHDRFDNRS